MLRTFYVQNITIFSPDEGYDDVIYSRTAGDRAKRIAEKQLVMGHQVIFILLYKVFFVVIQVFCLPSEL